MKTWGINYKSQDHNEFGFWRFVKNRIMSLYALLRTVLPRLLQAKVDRHNWGPTIFNLRVFIKE